MSNEEGTMPNLMILGPALDMVVEPRPTPAAEPGRVGIAFGEPPTEKGGIVNLAVVPGVEGDTRPLNVYVFFITPHDTVPVGEARTPEWFFAQAQPSASVSIAADTTSFTVAVPNVRPGIYFVQTVLEYPR
jgi:hypothetical protein